MELDICLEILQIVDIEIVRLYTMMKEDRQLVLFQKLMIENNSLITDQHHNLGASFLDTPISTDEHLCHAFVQTLCQHLHDFNILFCIIFADFKRPTP